MSLLERERIDVAFGSINLNIFINQLDRITCAHDAPDTATRKGITRQLRS